jgi:hypothetical protein
LAYVNRQARNKIAACKNTHTHIHSELVATTGVAIINNAKSKSSRTLVALHHHRSEEVVAFPLLHTHAVVSFAHKIYTVACGYVPEILKS